jgi:uncharacterized protein (DUF433 family)
VIISERKADVVDAGTGWQAHALRIAILERVMATVFDIGAFITELPGIHGGRPIIAGTGVTVQRIVVWYKLGLMPEEIAERLGHLSLAQVYAALLYYHANKEAVEFEIAAEDSEYERLTREHCVSRRITVDV